MPTDGNSIRSWKQLKNFIFKIKYNYLKTNFKGYSPLGKGNALKDELVLKLASKYQRTPAQIVLRWSVQVKTIL